jgi:TRAP-type transport system periplasmic protein
MIRMLSAAGKLFSLAIGILFALSVAANAEVWRMATKQPAGSPEGKAFAKFAELVGEYTKGKIEVKVFPSEQLGKTDAALEQLQAGTVHVYPEGPSYMRKWVSQMEFVGSPFLFKDRPHWVRFMHSPEVQGWLKQVEDKAGIAIIGDITAFVRGPYRCLVSKKPVKGLADLKGLKMRQFKNQTVIDLWGRLGAEVRVLGWTEVYSSISRGIVESVTSPIALVESMKFYEVAPHIIRTDEYPQTAAFMTNAKAYRGLTPELRAAVDRAHADASKYSADLMGSITTESLKRMAAKGVTYDEIDTSDIVNEAAKFYSELEKAGKLPDGYMKIVDAAR